MNAGAFVNSIALAVCAFIYVWRASRAGLRSATALDAALLGVCGALAGARIAAGLAAGGPHDVGAALRGGAGAMSWGAYGGGLLMASLRLGRRGVWARHLDAAAPAVLLGVAIARIGCFVNGDDFGLPCAHAWCMTFGARTDAFSVHLARGWIAADASRSLPVHPLQLYLAFAAAASALVVLVFDRRRPKRAGLVALCAATLYVGSRGPLERFRDRATPTSSRLEVSAHHGR